ncbi:putative late blight resistance protein homolog R1A-3 [Bidens hawaiensis]|uniref:putative late blight resistance protein homolog R1A-3 n=1 Tax=Bidens hawaiensis TaxID=980011 RepID=UPI00404959A1
MAEGFVKEASQRSLKEEGEHHLMDLIDRNLLIAADKSSNGGIKSCRLHDLLRELCLKKAREENFFKKTSISDSTSSMVKQRRMFIDYEALCEFSSHDFTTRRRSVLCLHNDHFFDNRNERWVPSFLLLKVLDLLNIPMSNLGKITMLVHLRSLAVWLRYNQSSFSDVGKLPFSKAKFGSLQTLIVKGKFQNIKLYPDKMVNLRHLRCDRIDFSIDLCAHSVFHLQTISRLKLDHRAQSLLESFPNIKKLGCSISSASTKHGLLSFALLTHLEALNIDKYIYGPLTLASPIRFPETLRKLTLSCLRLPWNYMSTIQRLPKLEVLKLLDSSFMGHMWETGDEQFHQLKLLKLEKLNIRFWEASSINFPRLRKLVVRRCDDLKEIPLGLGQIYTLEHIELDHSNSCVLESVSRIQETQREIGNNDIHVKYNSCLLEFLGIVFESSNYRKQRLIKYNKDVNR